MNETQKRDLVLPPGASIAFTCSLAVSPWTVSFATVTLERSPETLLRPPHVPSSTDWGARAVRCATSAVMNGTRSWSEVDLSTAALYSR